MTNLTAQKIDTEKLKKVFILFNYANGDAEYSTSQDELIQKLKIIACNYNGAHRYYNDDNYKDMENPGDYSVPGVYNTSTGVLIYAFGDTEYETYAVLTAADILDKLDSAAAAEFIEQLETEMREKFTIELD